ncbi:hypothetical protein BY996DRAFT_6710282 [Phakopsora pachyrhizi]|nr:hypothetical protein BY996DRAFT_6710282 [Phakopsora pachyrhizi]
MPSRRDNFEPSRKRSSSAHSVPELTAIFRRSSLRTVKWVGSKFKKVTGSENVEDDEDLWGTSFEQHADQHHREEVPVSNLCSTKKMALRQEAEIGYSPRQSLAGDPSPVSSDLEDSFTCQRNHLYSSMELQQSNASNLLSVFEKDFGSQPRSPPPPPTAYDSSLNPHSGYPCRLSSKESITSLKHHKRSSSSSCVRGTGEIRDLRPAEPTRSLQQQIPYPVNYPDFSAQSPRPHQGTSTLPSIKKRSSREVYVLSTHNNSSTPHYGRYKTSTGGSTQSVDLSDQSQRGYNKKNEQEIDPLQSYREKARRDPPKRSKNLWEEDNW